MTDDTHANRFLNIGELKNARQLGGYIGVDGRPVKDGLLIKRCQAITTKAREQIIPHVKKLIGAIDF